MSGEMAHETTMCHQVNSPAVRSPMCLPMVAVRPLLKAVEDQQNSLLCPRPRTRRHDITRRAITHIHSTGSTHLTWLLQSLAKLMGTGDDRITLMGSTTTPACIVHQHVMAHCPLEAGRTPLGLGVVFDGMDEGHHYSLLVRAQGRWLVFNPNGEFCRFGEALRTLGWQYTAVNLQQYISDNGGCGPAVWMLAHHVWQHATACMSIETISGLLTRYIHTKRTYQMDHALALRELGSAVAPEDALLTYSATNLCPWCALAPLSMLPPTWVWRAW